MPYYTTTSDYWDSTTTSTTCNRVVWYRWVVSASSTTTTDCTWWDSTSSYNYAPRAYGGRSPAEQAAIVRAHKPEAQTKALQLLMEHLTPEQRDTYKKNGWFIVEGGKSKQKYRIREREDLVANIDVLDGERTKHKLCGHCAPEKVPLYDHLLAQKVMLEVDEDRFLQLANRHAA